MNYRTQILKILFFFTISIFSANLGAQVTSNMVEGKFRIKVSEQLATQIEVRSISKNGMGIIETGNSNVDLLNSEYQVVHMKRLYPDAGIGSVIMFNRSGMKDERFLDKLDHHYFKTINE